MGTENRKRLHPSGAAEPNRRIFDHPPAGRGYFYGTPSLVAEVEIEPAVETTDANVNRPFRPVEMCLRFDHVERRLKRLGTWGAPGLLEELSREPASETLDADRPGLAMPVDLDVCIGRSVGCMEQLCRVRELEQYIGLGRPASAVAGFLGDGLIKRRNPAVCLLELCPERLEGCAVFLLQGRQSLKHFGVEGGAGVFGGSLDQPVQRISDYLCCVDSVEDGVQVFVPDLVGHRAPPSPPCAPPSSMSLKSMPRGGRAIRTCRPSCTHRRAQSRAAA